MKIQNRRDFWSGLIFIGVGTSFAAGALTYSFGTSARPGPGYFPFGLGLLLAFLGLLITIKAVVTVTPDGEPVGRIAWRPLLVVPGSLALFAFLLPHVGMLVSLPILVVTATCAGDEFQLGETLAYAAAMTLGCWLIFIEGLGLAIPLLPAFIVG